MVINSFGGALDGAFLITDTMKLLRAPVYTVGRIVCSAATMLLASGTKGHRYLMPHSKVMLHLPSVGMQGDSKQIEIGNREMQKAKMSMLKILQEAGVERTDKQLLKDIDREMWMAPQEAIDYGLADKIVDRDTLNEWLTPTHQKKGAK